MSTPYKLVPLQQGSKEWLEFRKSKIMASDSPIIMDVSPYSSPYQLWCEKMDVTRKENKPNMTFGNEMEPIIREKVVQELKTNFVPCVAQSTLIDWAGASLDGFSEHGDTALEIKCTNQEDHSLALQGKIPHKHYPQLQKQMYVMGIEIIFYVSYNKDDMKIIEVDRDEDYINLLLSKEQLFYDSLQNFIPPELTEKDYVKRLDNDFKVAAEAWLESKKRLKDFEELEKKNRDFLIKLCQNKPSEGYGIKVSKSIRRGQVDYSSVPQIAGIDLEPYRKPSVESWRIYS